MSKLVLIKRNPRRQEANTEEKRQSCFRLSWREHSPLFSLIDIKSQYNECIYLVKKKKNRLHLDDLAHAG